MSGIAAGLFLSQSAGAVASPLDAAQSFLSQYDHTQFNLLPASTPVAVSAQQAETVAFQQQWGAPGMSVSATLVNATVDGYCNEQADGTCAPIISNRPVWIVMIPNEQVPVPGGPDHAGSDSITGTVAVLVDANTGAYLMADVVPVNS